MKHHGPIVRRSRCGTVRRTVIDRSPPSGTSRGTRVAAAGDRPAAGGAVGGIWPAEAGSALLTEPGWPDLRSTGIRQAARPSGQASAPSAGGRYVQLPLDFFRRGFQILRDNIYCRMCGDCWQRPKTWFHRRRHSPWNPAASTPRSLRAARSSARYRTCNRRDVTGDRRVRPGR
jgi:hypothetical protein